MTVSELRTLVDNLDEYINIPGGIDKLKKMVLHLAVSGQLVPQDPSEGTGKELYRQIQAEKAELVKQGKIKKQKPLPETTEDGISFKVKHNWMPVRLGDLVWLEQGEKQSGEKMNYLQAKYLRGTAEPTIKTNGQVVDKGNRIILVDGENSGEVFITPERGYMGSTFKILGRVPLMDMEYVDIILRNLKDEMRENKIGAAIPHLDKKLFRNKIVGLPPLAEQKRIVAKVDNIFALIDQLAEVYKSEQAERSKLVASSLAQLAKAENDVKDSLALTHLSEIIRTKADAKILRQTILHLAVSGQLVPQDPSEGTGEELYQQIQAEKAELIKQGKIKVQKHQQSIGEDEILFKIPDSWKWVRLIEVSDRLSAGGDKPKDFSKLESDTNTIPVIANGETNKGVIGYTSEARVCVPSVTVSGRGTIGYSEVRDYPYTPIVRLIVVEPCSRLDLKYLKFVFTSILEVGQGTSIPQLTVPMVSPKPIPLPPFAEQGRIVTKTTQLLNLVSELETHLEK